MYPYLLAKDAAWFINPMTPSILTEIDTSLVNSLQTMSLVSGSSLSNITSPPSKHLHIIDIHELLYVAEHFFQTPT